MPRAVAQLKTEPRSGVSRVTLAARCESWSSFGLLGFGDLRADTALVLEANMPPKSKNTQVLPEGGRRKASAGPQPEAARPEEVPVQRMWKMPVSVTPLSFEDIRLTAALFFCSFVFAVAGITIGRQADGAGFGTSPFIHYEVVTLSPEFICLGEPVAPPPPCSPPPPYSSTCGFTPSPPSPSAPTSPPEPPSNSPHHPSSLHRRLLSAASPPLCPLPLLHLLSSSPPSSSWPTPLSGVASNPPPPPPPLPPPSAFP
ncbi:hypothetical protein CYMTET_49551 [Cymbomonas tetramitiformis]|uniref:Uncharacterized protein n=1 Tax=Cymbomonas tetramitiformis TaxID=36881 RepID=A0AAE0BR56_9CHLO|nr:hypothetical protein CYMTET_49551 [Cymbomonas tetramitiformis]